MKSVIAFCRRTGRRLAQYVNKLIRCLTANGEFRISVSVSIPFIAKIEVGYQTSTESKKEAS